VFLVMANSNGKSRLNLSVSNDGPALTFFDPSGQVRTIVGSTTAVPSHVNDNGIAEQARRPQSCCSTVRGSCCSVRRKSLARTTWHCCGSNQ
jgi:hypothetical protein